MKELTGVGSLVLTGRTAAVLAVRIAIRVFGRVAVTAGSAARLTRAQLEDFDVVDGRVVAVVAAIFAAVLRCSVFDALANVALAALDPLNVLHLLLFSRAPAGFEGEIKLIFPLGFNQRIYTCMKLYALPVSTPI